ncbi:MAG: gamma-glutamyl-gamma-aminobutyrate hydrolase family protein [Verrucomicrobiia bacterium]
MSSPRIAIVTNKPDHLGNHYRDWLATIHVTQLELFFHTPSQDIEKRFATCNALILTGGGDFSLESGAYASLSEAQEAKIYNTNPDRDQVEKILLQLALFQNKPVLGICRGLQSLNVFFHGTLIPDISKRLGNRCDPAHTTTPDELAQSGTPDRFHPVTFNSQSNFASILNITQPHTTNSYHHQAIDQLGKNLIATAFAPDGIIEEIVMQNNPKVMGVQFHPERMREENWIQQWTKNWLKN